MNATFVMRSSELKAAGTWSVSDMRGGPRVCSLCGLAPASIEKRGRPDPSTTLLEISGADERDPLRRSLYRCVNQKACADRVRFQRDHAS